MRRQHHLTPATYASNLQKPRLHHQGHSRLSCDPCRRKKVKCDQGRPCRACLKRGRESECTYGFEHVNSPPGSEMRTPRLDISFYSPDAGKHDLSALNERPGRLESSLGDLRETLTRSDGAAQINLGSFGKGGETEDLVSLLQAQRATVNMHEKYLLVKNWLNRGWLIKQKGVPYYVGSTGWLFDLSQFDEVVAMFRWRKTFGPCWRALNELKNEYNERKQTYLTAPFPVLAPAAPTREDLIALLPSQDLCTCLVSRFMSSSNMIHPVLDKDAFLAEVAVFWESRTPLSTTWLVLLLAIIAIGYRLPVYPSQKGNDAGFDGDAEGKRILSMVSILFFSSQSMQRRPGIPSLQILILIILSQKLDLHEPDGIDGQRGLLGVASRMTMSMGLHRDPTICYGMSDNDVEMRRKLWVTFVFLDLEHAIQCGMPFHLRATDYDSSIPANGDDADLAKSPEMLTPGGFVSLPDSEFTDATYVRYIYRALPVWIDATHMCHSRRENLPRAEIQSLAARLLASSTSIHPHLKPGSSSTSQAQEFVLPIQCAILDCFNQRMRMLLHRGLIGSSFFPDSRSTVLSCALAILNHQRSLSQLASHLPAEQHDAWLLFVMSQLRCDFARSICAIARILKESTESEFSEASPLDAAALLDTLHEALSIWSDSVAFSFNLAKEHMTASQAVAAAEERLRLAREHNRRAIDIGSAEAKPIIHALSAVSIRSLALSRQTITKRRSGDRDKTQINAPVENNPTPANPELRGMDTPTATASSSNQADLFSTDLWPIDDTFHPDLDMDVFSAESRQNLYSGTTAAEDPDWWFSQENSLGGDG